MKAFRWDTSVGEVELRLGALSTPWEGQTAAKRQSTGTALVSEILVDGEFALEIGWIDWQNGDREVRALSVAHPHPYVRRLNSSLRVGAHWHCDRLWGRFRLPVPIGEAHTSKRKTTVQEVSELIGVELDLVRRQAGGFAIGPHDQLLPPGPRRSDELVLISDPDSAASAFTALGCSAAHCRRF